MGAEICAAALLGATGLVGSFIASSGAKSTNQAAMDFNAIEAAMNRHFQEQMYNKQLADQEALYNKYQSPSAIAAQLAKIGVNPSSVFGKGSSLGGSVPSVPSPPSGSSASIGELQNPLAPYANALTNTAKDTVQVLNGLTDKHLKDAQTVKVLAEAKGQEYANGIMRVKEQISKWQIPEEAKAKIDNLVTSAALNEAKGRLTDAEKDLKFLMQTLTDKQIKLTDEQVNQLVIEVSWLDRIRHQEFELLGEKKKTEKSQQAANYGSARLSTAQAKTEDQIRGDVARYHRFVGNIQETKDFVTSNTAWNEVQQSLYELQAAKLVPEQVAQAIETAKKNNDWYTTRMLLNIVDEGIKGYGTYYGAKTGQGFVNAQDTRNRIQSDFNDWQKQHHQPKKVYDSETGDVRWQW